MTSVFLPPSHYIKLLKLLQLSLNNFGLWFPLYKIGMLVYVPCEPWQIALPNTPHQNTKAQTEERQSKCGNTSTNLN